MVVTFLLWARLGSLKRNISASSSILVTLAMLERQENLVGACLWYDQVRKRNLDA